MAKKIKVEKKAKVQDKEAEEREVLTPFVNWAFGDPKLTPGILDKYFRSMAK